MSGWNIDGKKWAHRESFREFLLFFLFQVNKPSLDHSERLHTGRRSRSPDVIVPPPSPVHCFEPLSSKSMPGWTRLTMLPQDILKE